MIRNNSIRWLILFVLVASMMLSALPVIAQGENGTVESMELIYKTDNSEYYRLVYWSDGLRITGYLGIPLRDQPCPAIIYNRGGVWDAGKLTGVEIVPYVEAGYVTVASQYRGNDGGEGGDQFGGADLNDVLNLIALLKSLPQVDPARIGMFGASRGGMMTYMALKWQTESRSSDIKAAVTVGGIADLLMWIEERPDVMDKVLMPIFGATPEQRPEFYNDRSALQWAHLITVPLLVVHGEADIEVPIEQSERLVESLRYYGRTVEFQRVMGADHSLSAFWGGADYALDFFSDYLARRGEDLSFEAHQPAIEAVTAWFYVNHH